MKITDDLIGRRVRLMGDPKDAWIYIIGISLKHSDYFVGLDKMKAVKTGLVDNDWELLKESEVIQFLIKIFTWCSEELSPFRAWYRIVRRNQ